MDGGSYRGMLHYDRLENGQRKFSVEANNWSIITHISGLLWIVCHERRACEGKLVMVKQTKTITRRFDFKETESPEQRQVMVQELRSLLEQLRKSEKGMQFKELTIHYTDGAIDKYRACEEPCLIMQELAE